MKKTFKIIFKNELAIVLSLTNERIEEILANVEKELSKKEFSGVVVFDLLIGNGLSDRFYKAKFEKTINLKTFTSMKVVNDVVADCSNTFYAKKLDLIESSILPRIEKQKIIKTLKKYISAPQSELILA